MVSDKNIALLVPDGTGIKNYLYSDVFKGVNASLHLIHDFDIDTIQELKKEVSLESTTVLPSYKETIKEKFLREIIHLARIRFHAKRVDNYTILKFYKRKEGDFRVTLFYSVIEVIAKRFDTYKSIIRLEKWYKKALEKNRFYDQSLQLLKELNIDTLFCTHQRALKAPTVFAAAKKLGIKTTTIIYSWDNIPKARLALRADTYFVWSQYMANELKSFYPEINTEAILVTGTPQFEFYFKVKNCMPKSIFYDRYNLSPSKFTICFSGDDVHTSPYDPEYLNDLAIGIIADGAENKYQIIFRRCPVDVSGRYDWVLNKFPDLITAIEPLWNFNKNQQWTTIYPTREDVSLLVSIAYYSDVVVNVGSTMAFDFGMFKKPCIFINYNQRENDTWSVDTIYSYQHFRSMPSKEAVFWWNKKEEIGTLLQQIQINPENEINKWFNIVVNYPSKASQRIKKQLI